MVRMSILTHVACLFGLAFRQRAMYVRFRSSTEGDKRGEVSERRDDVDRCNIGDDPVMFHARNPKDRRNEKLPIPPEASFCGERRPTCMVRSVVTLLLDLLKAVIISVQEEITDGLRSYISSYLPPALREVRTREFPATYDFAVNFRLGS